MPIFFVRLPELLEQLAVGKTTLYARIKQGTFPPPVKFGERVSAWPEHEVDTVAMLICDQQQKRIFRSWSLSS